MKLETALHAPVAGRVAEVLADVNTQVDSSAKLVRIEPDPEQDEAEALRASASRPRWPTPSRFSHRLFPRTVTDRC